MQENDTEMTIGIVRAPHCFLYEKPGEDTGENASQTVDELLSGWAVRGQSEADHGWVKVETHYGYQGYARMDQFWKTGSAFLKERDQSSRFVMTSAFETDVLTQPAVQATRKETLPQNAIVECLSSDQEGWTLIRSASCTEGYVHTACLRERRDNDRYLYETEANEKYFVQAAAERMEKIGKEEQYRLRKAMTKSARTYLGTQYRWGGKSRRGIDCSGLAFMSYLENGILIYRDAKMPEGYPIHKITRQQLQEGDLIYFPGHVAIYLGDERYIHATGYALTPCVTINSLNVHDTDYRDDLARQITGYGSVFTPERLDENEPDETWTSKLSIEDSTAQERDKDLYARLQSLTERLSALPGYISVYYKDLLTNAVYQYDADRPMEAASIIKLYLMAAIFQGFEDGDFSPQDKIPVHRKDCVPSCGVLTYLDEGKEVSLRDLVELMIIVSDNTACNVLLDFYGEERMKRFIREHLGLTRTCFQRKMFDSARAAQGLDNFTTASETAGLLEKIYRGELVSREASAQMLRILEHQRLNGKIPFYLHAVRPKPTIAHKTGENDGVTHDVAIIEGDKPFLLLFMSNHVDVPEVEKLIAQVSLEIYEKHRQGER